MKNQHIFVGFHESRHIFAGFHESRLFNNTAKQGVYFWYVDDSFVTFGSELGCDHFQEKLNLLFTLEEKNHSLNFLDVLVEKEGTRFLTSIYWITTFIGQYICSNYFSQKTRKISFIKTSVHRAIMICPRTKLGSEINNIKQLFIENGYPADVLFSCINQKLANFATETTFGTEKSPSIPKLPWIGSVTSKFENQINKAITSCFYAVKLNVVYNTRVIIPSAKKYCVLTTQKQFCGLWIFMPMWSLVCQMHYMETSRKKETACSHEHQEEK